MKKYATLLLLSAFVVTPILSQAQMSGDNIFMPGHYIEIAIAPNGSFGSTVALPSGYYHNSESIGVYDHATGSYTSTANRLAIIYDAGHDGWATGTPAFFGDYTLPGTPYEGWDVEINGTQGNAWYQNYESGTSGFSGGLAMSGSNTSYTNSGGVLTAVWTGTAGSGGALSIVQTTVIDTNASWINVTTKFKNTTSSTLSNVYYMRAFDPDNDDLEGGSYSTHNTINYQNDYDHRVEVTAAGTHWTSETIALATKDCRARCWSGTWATGGGTCAQYYAGSVSSCLYSAGANNTGDNAIGLVYNLGNIGAGDSTTISYAFVFNGSEGIDSAVSDPQLVVNGTAIDSIDTVTACSFSGDTLGLSIIGGSTDNWVGAVWTWSPTTYLLSDTGVSNGVLMGSVTSTITYTITGTDSALGTCEYRQFLLTVVPGSTSTPTVTPVSYCTGATATPLTATGTSLLWYAASSGGTGSTTAPTPATDSIGTFYYYVSQTIAGCESSRAALAVTISPGAAAIAGPAGVCDGFTITLTDSTTTGSWSSSSPSVASVSTSTGVVYGLTTGATTISYTLPSGCFVTRSVTVNEQPGTISVPGAVCVGANLTLADTTSGGTWTSGNTGIATIGSSTGTAGGVSSGTAPITYATSAGCYVTASLTVNPLPSSISGPAGVCAGSTITLSATPTGTWSSSSGARATVTGSGGVVSGVSAGAVTITFTLGTGCYSTDAVTVYALPAAITGSNLVCEDGGTTTLTSSGTTGTWTSGNTSVATVGSTTGVVTGVASGTAGITYTITSTGCSVDTTVNVNPLPKVINGPSAVCVNSTITLSDTVTGGVWSSSASGIASINSSTGVVTGISNGTAIITYSLGTGCSITTTITVNPLPVGITGTMAVCEAGSVTHLSDGTSGGSWSTSDASKATVDASGNVTGVSAGSVTITYQLTATSCLTTTSVTVNPLPSNISGPTAVCQGLTINLTDVGSGTWTSGNTSVATITGSGMVTGVSNGTSVITYMLGTGCITTSTITVNSLPPTPTGTTSVCVGLVTVLTDGTTGGGWTSSNTSKATVDGSGNVTGVAAGAVTITYTLGTGCISTVGVTVNPLPAAITGASAVCNTYTTTFVETTGGGSWSSGNSAVATVSGGVVGGASPGSTTITYTLAGTGCIQTAPITVNALPSTISGSPDVCVNASTNLTDGTTGSGTWTSNNTSVATVDVTTGTVYGVSAGTATITYTAGGGCFVTMTMTVHALPANISGTMNVCEGSTVTLTDPSGGGTWSSSNTSLATIGSASGTVSGIAAGSLNITYTYTTTGCFITGAFLVNTTPVAITGTTQVCEAGSTTSLYDATSGGSWSSGATGTATVDGASGVVTGVAAGTASITYTLGTCYNTTSVTVNPLPGAIISPVGDTMLCPGDMVMLTSSTGRGYTYQWNNGSGAMSGETDNFYEATTGAPYSVTITSSFGCVSTSTPMTVSVNPATASIAASGATTFCSGTGATMAVTSGAAYSYQWMIGGAGISGATGSSYTATTAGDFSVMVSNLAGCTATSSAITMTTLPAPTPTLTASGTLTFCLGDSVALTANTGTGLTYQWMNGGTNIPGATNINYTANATGNYQVKETNSSSCNSSSAIAAVTTLALPVSSITATGPTTFCSGGSVILNTATGAGGTVYQWYKNGAVITGATHSGYVATTSGNYAVRVIAPTGCSSFTSPATAVDEVAVPVITAMTNTRFCWGGSALLAVNVTAAVGVTYQWQKNGVNIAGATSSIYNATSSGNYSCIITVGGGCTSAAIAVTVTELPLPDPIIFFDGTTLSTGSYYTYFQWYRNGVPVSGNGSKLVPNSTGNYTVKVVDSNGCQSVSNVYIVRTIADNRSLSVNGVINPNDIHIYPNPAQSILHIDALAELKAVITALDGRKVAEQANAHEIDITSLANGVYLLMLYDNDGQMVKVERFVKN